RVGGRHRGRLVPTAGGVVRPGLLRGRVRSWMGRAEMVDPGGRRAGAVGVDGFEPEAPGPDGGGGRSGRRRLAVGDRCGAGESGAVALGSGVVAGPNRLVAVGRVA